MRLYSKVSPEAKSSLSEHDGLTLWAMTRCALRCHLIVSSLSRFVNTPSNVTAVHGTESTASPNSDIGLNHALLNPHSILVRGRCLLGMQCGDSVKRSSSLRYRVNHTLAKRPKIVWGGGQVVSSVGFHSRIVALLTPCPCWGGELKALFENTVACNNSTDNCVRDAHGTGMSAPQVLRSLRTMHAS